MKLSDSPKTFDRICAHAGGGGGDGSPLVSPIVQSTTYCRDGVGSDAEFQYSRVGNPTVARLEAALGELEDSPPAVCFSTGLGAEFALFLALLRSGDHLVCGSAVYGGTTRLAERFLNPLGIETTLVDTTSTRHIEAALRPETRLIFVETPSNPTLALTDLRAVATLAEERGIPLAVDNTFLTPVLQQPLALGATCSVLSTTKFIEGHSVAPGGAIVSRDEVLLTRLRFVRKSTGGIQTPLHAWLTLQGLKTLPLRIRHQSASAARIAEWLSKRSELAAVHYPTLADPDLAGAQHLGADGAVVSFEFGGGLEAARRFADEVRLCRLVEHVGSVETLITHPASMTHADVAPEDRRRAGLPDGLVRLSVGLEHVDDLIADLDRALSLSQDLAGGAR